MIWLWLQDSASCKVRKLTREFSVLTCKYKVRLGDLCKNPVVLAHQNTSLGALKNQRLAALIAEEFLEQGKVGDLRI